MAFRERLDEIEILAARGLYSLAKRQLKKLIKHAEELDAFPYLQLAQQWERRLLKRLPGKKRLLTLDNFRQQELEWKRKQEQENNGTHITICTRNTFKRRHNIYIYIIYKSK